MRRGQYREAVHRAVMSPSAMDGVTIHVPSACEPRLAYRSATHRADLWYRAARRLRTLMDRDQCFSIWIGSNDTAGSSATPLVLDPGYANITVLHVHGDLLHVDTSCLPRIESPRSRLHGFYTLNFWSKLYPQGPRIQNIHLYKIHRVRALALSLQKAAPVDRAAQRSSPHVSRVHGRIGGALRLEYRNGSIRG